MAEPPALRLSLFRILWTDYPAFYAVLVPVVSCIVYLAWTPDWRGYGAVISPEARPFFNILAILAGAGGFFVLAWRLLFLYNTFRRGIQIKGKISKAALKRDHGRVEYTYIFEHKEYFSGAEVHRNAQTKRLKVGDHVILVVDRLNPLHAFIRDLYTHS